MVSRCFIEMENGETMTPYQAHFPICLRLTFIIEFLPVK